MLKNLITFIDQNQDINNKAELAKLVQEKFCLVKDRSVYYCPQFAVRFSSSKGGFKNTVLSLSALQKYDDRPFVVCLVAKDKNVLFLANSTFLKKVSHSSHQLRTDNIKGSFNGSDIERSFNDTNNVSEHFDDLFEIHKGIAFEENLIRLVEATNNIVPFGKKFSFDQDEEENILAAPKRAKSFVESARFAELKAELDDRVQRYEDEILVASLIENVNIRGNIIEYLIAGKNERTKEQLMVALKNKTDYPTFKNENELGDYVKDFGNEYHTATDIKTKILVLHSNPKAYNLDKMLEFLSRQNSIFMFYFVGVGFKEILTPVLVSMFHSVILKNTILLKHWAGRNSRGVTQLHGRNIKELFEKINIFDIEISSSQEFLTQIMDL